MDLADRVGSLYKSKASRARAKFDQALISIRALPATEEQSSYIPMNICVRTSHGKVAFAPEESQQQSEEDDDHAMVDRSVGPDLSPMNNSATPLGFESTPRGFEAVQFDIRVDPSPNSIKEGAQARSIPIELRNSQILA